MITINTKTELAIKWIFYIIIWSWQDCYKNLIIHFSLIVSFFESGGFGQLKVIFRKFQIEFQRSGENSIFSVNGNQITQKNYFASLLCWIKPTIWREIPDKVHPIVFCIFGKTWKSRISTKSFPTYDTVGSDDV